MTAEQRYYTNTFIVVNLTLILYREERRKCAVIKLIDPTGMEVINGDESAMTSAKQKMEKAQTDFNKNYGGVRDKTKNDFASKADYNNYKKDLKALKTSEKNFTNANMAYEHTQKSIENFAEVDPENFAKVNNLTSTDKNGNVSNIDVLVKSGRLPESISGGFTSARIDLSSGKIISNVIRTTLDLYGRINDNTFAHEMGHAFAIAADPIGYLNSIDRNYADCQSQHNKYSRSSTIALDWQFRYDNLVKKK